jgi:general secretion pathway protein I
VKAAHQSAFTLIEIMVALAIIAITLGAIIENTTASNRNTQYLRDKTVASWVAMNEIARIRASREWGGSTSRKGEVEMAGRTWLWKMAIRNTDNVNVRELIVDVFIEDQESQALASMTGYMAKL